MTEDISIAIDICDNIRRKFSSQELDNFENLLENLKMHLLGISYFPTDCLVQENHKQSLLLAREMLEIGTLYFVQRQDITSFERYMSQLKHYYFDYGEILNESPIMYQILGLNLLSLLSRKKLSDFHTEVEILPPEKLRTDVYLRHPIQLEQHLMEGCYNKIIISRDNVPSQNYKFFVNILLNTTREEIVSCIESSYRSLSLNEAMKMLYISNFNEIDSFANKHNWEIDGDYLVFHSNTSKSPATAPSHEIMFKFLEYAKDLEAII